MQIDDVQRKTQLSHVGLGLSKAEATELRDTLEMLLSGHPERHEHISSADYQTGLTVWLQSDD